MRPMRTVAFACDYGSSLAELRQDWHRGALPRQHLWGAEDLSRAGYSVRDVTVRRRGLLGQVADFSSQRAVGDIPAQMKIVLGRPRGIAYAMAPGLVRGL